MGLVIKEGENGSAAFDESGKYRYWLERHTPDYWQDLPNLCGFIMLNPSTADHEQDDPTIRRCMAFAQSWGYTRIVVTNLFALRATSPKELYKHPDPVGPENMSVLMDKAKLPGTVVCAWGAHGKFMDQGDKVLKALKTVINDIEYLKMTKCGQPGHPLYLKKNLIPQKFQS